MRSALEVDSSAALALSTSLLPSKAAAPEPSNMLHSAFALWTKLPLHPRLVLLGILGGAIGSAVRGEVSLALAPYEPAAAAAAAAGAGASSVFTAEQMWPSAIFTVNVVGSFILGALTQFSSSYKWPRDLLVFTGGGFCGGLTSFSSVSVDALRTALVEQHSGVAVGLAIAYIITTQVSIVICALLGFEFAKRVAAIPALAPVPAPAPAPAAAAAVAPAVSASSDKDKEPDSANASADDDANENEEEDAA
jgi:CrcB protein